MKALLQLASVFAAAATVGDQIVHTDVLPESWRIWVLIGTNVVSALLPPIRNAADLLKPKDPAS